MAPFHFFSVYETVRTNVQNMSVCYPSFLSEDATGTDFESKTHNCSLTMYKLVNGVSVRNLTREWRHIQAARFSLAYFASSCYAHVTRPHLLVFAIL